MHRILITVAAVTVLAAPALAQSVPASVQGSWDVSRAECEAPGSSVSQIDIDAGTIHTFGGEASIREVTGAAPVIFVAADFVQLEGVETVRAGEPAYFRLTQRDGTDRLNLIWKDVQTVNLVRCGAPLATTGAADPAPADPVQTDSATLPGQAVSSLPPIETGLWVRAGDDCTAPANAGWKVYDGLGLYGARSEGCQILEVTEDAGTFYVIQACRSAADGTVSNLTDILVPQAARRFGLIEDGETAMQDFNWCGPQLHP